MMSIYSDMVVKNVLSSVYINQKNVLITVVFFQKNVLYYDC